MLQAIKLTFGSVWGWLGIIVGAISLINLGVMYFEVGIGPVLERVVETYMSIVHVGFDYLFFWIDWKMPPWLKDWAAVYLVFGSAFARGIYQLPPFHSHVFHKLPMRINGPGENAGPGDPTPPGIFLSAFDFIFWPLSLWVLATFRAKVDPIAVEDGDVFEVADGKKSYRGITIEKYRDLCLKLVLINFIVIPTIAIIFLVTTSGL